MKRINVTFYLLTVLVFLTCFGCAQNNKNIATNSAINFSIKNDVIKAMLSNHLPTVKRGSSLQINVGDTTLFPDSPLLYIFSETNRNASINLFKATWMLGVASQNSQGVATYNRKTRMLWHRMKNMSNGKCIYYVYSGVTRQMLYQAAVSSIAKGGGYAFDDLTDYGCKRVDKSFDNSSK